MKLWFLFVIILSIVVLIILNVNCGINFMVRLEKVRLINNFFNVDGIEEVFYNVLMIRRFLMSVMIENVKFKMVKLSMKWCEKE